MDAEINRMDLRPGLYPPKPARIVAVKPDGTLIKWFDCMAVPFGLPGEYQFDLSDLSAEDAQIVLETGDVLYVFNPDAEGPA